MNRRAIVNDAIGRWYRLGSRKREAVALAKRLVRVLPRVPFALPSCTRAMLEADAQVTL